MSVASSRRADSVPSCYRLLASANPTLLHIALDVSRQCLTLPVMLPRRSWLVRGLPLSSSASLWWSRAWRAPCRSRRSVTAHARHLLPPPPLPAGALKAGACLIRDVAALTTDAWMLFARRRMDVSRSQQPSSPFVSIRLALTRLSGAASPLRASCSPLPVHALPDGATEHAVARDSPGGVVP